MGRVAGMGCDGLRVVVTGAARGIGFAVASEFAASGAHCVGLDIRGFAKGAYPNLFYMICDVADDAAVTQAFDAILMRLGGIDVLVAAAGLDRPMAPGEIRAEDWDHVMNVNARGTFLTNQAAYRIMRTQGAGAIINFGSYAGIRGMKDRGAYSAAKAAIAGWSRAAAQAWGQEGIRVNVVAPVMRTEIAERYLASIGADARDELMREAAKRAPRAYSMGDVSEDLFPLIRFLAGDGSRHITGQTFSVDGGMTMLGS